MKKNWILAAALACASSMGAAIAVNADEAYRVYSVSDGRTARSVSQAIQDESASDAMAMPAAAPAGDGTCDACEAPAEEEEDCPRWYLFNQDNCHGIKAHGWINGGLFVNSHGTNSNYNGPVTFPDRNDGQINQVYGVLEKPIDTSETCWDIGGRIDVLYGTDWIYNTQLGWEVDHGTGLLLDGWNNSPYYGIVTPQAYAEAGYGDLSVKVGRFYTVMGYEVVTAPNNFFATHAYTMQYAEPFGHSGLLATYKVNDNWTAMGGVVNGWDRFYAASDLVHDRASFLGGAVYTPCHEEYTITLTGITGSEPSLNDLRANTTRHLYSLVFSWNVTDKLNYVLQHDNGFQNENFTAVGGAAAQNAEWYGINQYLFYTINDCWKAGVRAEWFRDDDGARVAGIRPTNGADLGNDAATGGGFAGNFYEVSLGLNWTPHANLIVRPEVRYDWYDGVGAPFGDGTSGSQILGGFDAVFLW